MHQQVFIDYKKPICNQYDRRTTNYISHHYKPDVHFGDSLHPSIENKYLNKHRPPDNFKTLYQETYMPKYHDPEIIRNPKIRNPQFIKPYDQKYFQNTPKLHAKESIQYSSFQPLPEKKIDSLPKIQLTKTVDNSKINITADSSGYNKYLDLMATSNMLHYPKHTNNALSGIGAKNNITLWNWFGVYQKDLGRHIELPENISDQTEKMCLKFPAPLCPKRHREFISLVKHVPNSGLTTESRSNYQKIDLKVKKQFDTTKQKAVFTSAKKTTDWKTETSIYGSAEPVNKYVDTMNKIKH